MSLFWYQLFVLVAAVAALIGVGIIGAFIVDFLFVAPIMRWQDRRWARGQVQMFDHAVKQMERDR